MRKGLGVVRAAGVLAVMGLWAVPRYAAAGHHQHCKIVVERSGDHTGVTDAVRIQAALEACPPGCEVVLEKGVYYVSEPIEVTPDKIDPDLPFGPDNIVPGTGFDGTLKGAGKHAGGTTIRAVRNSATGEGFPQRDIYETYWVEGQGGGLPILLYFYRPEHVTVQDLALEVIDPAPAALYRNPFDQTNDTPDDPQGTALLQLLLTRNGSFTAVIKNVKLSGVPSESPGNFNGYNLGYASISAGGDPIDLLVKDCDFSHANTGMEFFSVGPNSVAVYHDNTFSDHYESGIWLGWNTPTTTTILQNNEFFDCIPITTAGIPGEIVACDNRLDGVPMPNDCE